MLLPLLALSTPAAKDIPWIIKTAHSTIYISCLSSKEGFCERVAYRSVSDKGLTLKLHGTADFSLCADQITPCMLTGWTFVNKTYVYHVEYPTGTLTVQKQGKTVLTEPGTLK